jgi:hypothetical protein
MQTISAGLAAYHWCAAAYSCWLDCCELPPPLPYTAPAGPGRSHPRHDGCRALREQTTRERSRWLDQFVHLLGHTGNYTREEAIAAIDAEGILPDMLSFNPSKPAKYPTAEFLPTMSSIIASPVSPRVNARPDGLKPHTIFSRSFRTLARHIQRRASGTRDRLAFK